MKLFLYLFGIISAFACSCNVLEIMNGNATKLHLFFAIFTGSLCVSSFITFFNLSIKNLYGEDKDKLNKGNKNMGDVSDGYHTFNDLYKQRMILFATLVGLFPDLSWKTKRHENGEPCFPDSDYFLVTIETPEGNYGYHFDMKYWNNFKCKEIEKAKPWDGYTEDDAYRLLSLVQRDRFLNDIFKEDKNND